jgi:hypothetical protein
MILLLWLWAGLTLFCSRLDTVRCLDSRAKLVVFIMALLFWPLCPIFTLYNRYGRPGSGT